MKRYFPALLVLLLAVLAILPVAGDSNDTSDPAYYLTHADTLAGQKDMSRYNPVVTTVPVQTMNEDTALFFPNMTGYREETAPITSPCLFPFFRCGNPLTLMIVWNVNATDQTKPERPAIAYGLFGWPLEKPISMMNSGRTTSSRSPVSPPASVAARFGRAGPQGLPKGAGPDTIPIEIAYNNTVETFWAFTIGGPYGMDQNWTSAAVDPELVILYDVSGQPLYYEFYLMTNRTAPGYFWTAADRRLGAGVFRINEWPAPLNRTLKAMEAEEIAAGRYPGNQMRAEKTVVYGGNYRSSTMVTLVNSTTGSAETVIVEDYTREVIPITGITLGERSGSAQSIIAAIPDNEAADRRRQGESHDANVSRMIGYVMTRGIDIRQPLSEESRETIREYLENPP